MNLYYLSHLRLNRFNFLTVQGIYAERTPSVYLFIYLLFPNIQNFVFGPLERKNVNWKRLQFKLQAFDKYVLSSDTYGLKKF